jgi:5-formyltetrahydrofolate cyclo-ligase
MVFDPEVVARLRIEAKAEIRKRMRALRAAVGDAARQTRSTRIVENVAASEPFARAERVALFWPMLERHEVDLRPLDLMARAYKKRVLYPQESRPGEIVLRYAEPSDLSVRGHLFAEPPASAEEGGPGDDLLIVVPALGVCLDGQRIGYGKGFYDRLLARMAPPSRSMAVAFEFQLLAEVPASQEDRPVGFIATDARLCAATAPTR